MLNTSKKRWYSSNHTRDMSPLHCLSYTGMVMSDGENCAFRIGEQETFLRKLL